MRGYIRCRHDLGGGDGAGWWHRVSGQQRPDIIGHRCIGRRAEEEVEWRVAPSRDERERGRVKEEEMDIFVHPKY